MDTVAKLGPHNQELAQFLCLGDRMDLLKFCTEKKPVFGESQNSKRKKKHYDSIRKKMMLAIGQPNERDGESDEEVTKSHKMIGNQNAKKETRTVEIGWYHEGVNVRGCLGGGTRKMTVMKTYTANDLLEEAKRLYFPDGISRRHVKAEDCVFTLRDFMHNPLADGMTVGTFSDSVKMTGRLRFYMYSEISPEAPISSSAKSPSKFESNDSPSILKRSKKRRKLPDFPTTTETSTNAVSREVVSPPKSKVTTSDIQELTNTSSLTPIDEALIIDGIYWPPVEIDSEIILGCDPNATVDLSETIPDIPLHTRDSSPFPMVCQSSSKITLPDSVGYDSLESDSLFEPRIKEKHSGPLFTSQAILLEPLCANTSSETPSANLLDLPVKTDSCLIKTASQSIVPEPPSTQPMIRSERQSTISIYLPKRPSSTKSVSYESSIENNPHLPSKTHSILPAISSVLPQSSSSQSSLLESQPANPTHLLQPTSASNSVTTGTLDAYSPTISVSPPSTLSTSRESSTANPTLQRELSSTTRSVLPECTVLPRSSTPIQSTLAGSLSENESFLHDMPLEIQSFQPGPQLVNPSIQSGPRSPTPPRDTERNIRIRRSMLQSDMISSFKHPSIIEETVTFTFVDERGLDVQGVSRDAYTSFWDSFLNSSTKGEQERVPLIMPKLQREDWMAIGRILVKGFCDLGIFPINISRAFLAAMLYGEKELSEDLLIDSFKRYITGPERTVLEKALTNASLEEDDEDDFQDMLGRMDCTSVPTTNTRGTIIQVAHTELIQQAKYALDAIASVARESLLANLPTLDSLLGLYKSKEPSCRKILKLLKVEPSNTQENNIFNYLKQFIRGLTPELIVKFLQFVTGAQVICVDKIEIAFNKTVGLARIPIARTCGPVLELSLSYLSFTEFRQEFLNVLSSHSSQKFDID